MYDLWFKNFPANAKYAAAVHDTFMDGGYYKIDANEPFANVNASTPIIMAHEQNILSVVLTATTSPYPTVAIVVIVQ